MKRFRKLLASAFSLVEVVMALGVISFAMVGMLGLLSVGFTAAKKATNDTRGSTMSAQMISYLRNSTYAAYTTASMKNTTLSAFFDNNAQLQINLATGALLATATTSSAYQCQIWTTTVSSGATGLAPDGKYGVMTMTFSWPLTVATVSRRQQEVIYATLPK